MIHTVIVPGVGGSEPEHWQSWLQHQLKSCSRVQQQDWNQPVLHEWVQEFVKTVQSIQEPIQIVAHSFGCLTAVAAFAQHPKLNQKIKNLVLVAPANPARFGSLGFAADRQNNYQPYFYQLQLQVPCQMIISENDPWLGFDEAMQLSKAWKIKPKNLGQVGHINVASGFGPFPEIYDFLISKQESKAINFQNESNYLVKFAM